MGYETLDGKMIKTQGFLSGPSCRRVVSLVACLRDFNRYCPVQLMGKKELNWLCNIYGLSIHINFPKCPDLIMISGHPTDTREVRSFFDLVMLFSSKEGCVCERGRGNKHHLIQ